MPRTDISNTDKTIDASEVRKRIEELEEQLGDDTQTHFDLTMEQWDEMTDAEKWAKIQEYGIEGEDYEVDELKALKAFADEIDDSALQHGETLIHEDHFEDYARELAEDMEGETMRQAAWPNNCIDWEKAANELKQDYTSADWDGVTYYYRS